jgi:hypothetical protein
MIVVSITPLPHPGRRGHRAVEARQGDHLEDVGDPAPLLADHPAQRAAQVRFAGCIRNVPHFVFQLVDMNGVLFSIRFPAREQETAQASVRVGQHQESVRHRGRDEELVADQFVCLPGAAASQRPGAGGIGAHVAAALLLGHRHADGEPALLFGRQAARVIFAIGNARQPFRGDVRLLFQGRHAGEGHHDRAAVAGFHLRLQVQHGRADHVRASTGFDPRQGVQLVVPGHRHQAMVSRVILHFVDAVAVAVVCAQPWRVLVGLAAPFDPFGRAARVAEFAEALLTPLSAGKRGAA